MGCFPHPPYPFRREKGRFKERYALVVRLREGVTPMWDNMLNVTKKQVEHIYEGRVRGDGSSAEKIAESVERIVSSKKPRVAKGNTPTSQEIANIRDGRHYADVAYVSVFRKKERVGAFSRYLGLGERVGIVTTMKKDKRRLGK